MSTMLPMVSRRRSVSHCYERFWERWERMCFLSHLSDASLGITSKYLIRVELKLETMFYLAQG